MSHIVKLKVKINRPDLLREVAERDFGLKVVEKEKVEFYSFTRHTGMTIYLPGWRYPVLVNDQGELVYDNYNGAWGDQAQLDALVQSYVIATVYAEVGSSGIPIDSETMADGTVKLRLPVQAFA